MAAAPPELVAFCDREYPRIVGALSLYCGDRDVARELAQDAIVRVCRDWATVSGMAAPGAWLHRVAINLANSHYRRRAAERRARVRQEARAGDGRHTDPDAADRLATRGAVAALPARQRTALVLRYYADLPMADVAAAMGITESSARSAVTRALAALRRELELDELTDDREVVGRVC